MGYMARAMVQATMPHKRVKGNEFTRRNGHFILSLMAPLAVGLPYGSIPRVLMAWLTTEAVRTKSRDLVLGDTLSAFMGELGLVPTGGRWGSITRLKEQTKRLFASTVTCTYDDADKTEILGYRVADRAVLWWDHKDPRQAGSWQSVVTLTEPFYREIIERPIPVDMRALKALKRSPMALDIYCWLTYRLSYLSKPTPIPWEALAAQFGSEYARMRDFKAAFLGELKRVLVVYPGAAVTEGDRGLVLRPGNVHVLRRTRG
jgi:hypothetical protein